MSRRADFSTIKPLSSATTGGMNLAILLVKKRDSGTLYIEKRLAKQDIARGTAQRELRALQQCQRHCSIIQYRADDFSHSPQLGYGSIYMQYCELGDMSRLIARYATRASSLPNEAYLWKVFSDMASALCYLHTGRDVMYISRCAQAQAVVPTMRAWNRIVHRDIKPGNLFLSAKDQHCAKKYWPTVVLGDFGLCTSVDDVAAGRASGSHNSGGTPGFEGPEAPRFCCRSDVYQLALSISCLAQMQQEPGKGRRFGGDYPLPRGYRDEGLRQLMIRCLRSDPGKRPLPSELPMLVWKMREAWSRTNDRADLPKWALG